MRTLGRIAGVALLMTGGADGWHWVMSGKWATPGLLATYVVTALVMVLLWRLVTARVKTRIRQAREERRWNAYGRKGDEEAA